MLRALALGFLLANTAAARTPVEREHRVASPHGTDMVYEPRAPGPQPAYVFLHALCGASWHFGLTLEDAISTHGWLISPEANHKCGPGLGASWSGGGDAVANLVDASVARAAALVPPTIAVDAHLDEAAPRVLIGFSQGAWIAVDVARARPQHYRGLVLMAMALDSSATALRAAGVKRVVLACGERNAAYGSMRTLAARLTSDGYPARFVSLGKVGHTIPLDANERLREPLTWVASD